MEKYGGGRQTTDENIILCMCLACWITKATDTHPEYVILTAHSDNGYADMPQCYVIHTLPILLSSLYRHASWKSQKNHWRAPQRQETSLLVRYECKGKGKAVPLQAFSGPEGSRKLRFPDFMTAPQDGGKVVSLTHRPLNPQEIHLVLISVRG